MFPPKEGARANVVDLLHPAEIKAVVEKVILVVHLEIQKGRAKARGTHPDPLVVRLVRIGAIHLAIDLLVVHRAVRCKMVNTSLARPERNPGDEPLLVNEIDLLA